MLDCKESIRSLSTERRIYRPGLEIRTLLNFLDLLGTPNFNIGQKETVRPSLHHHEPQARLKSSSQEKYEEGFKRLAQRSPFLPHQSVRPSLIIAVGNSPHSLKGLPLPLVCYLLYQLLLLRICSCLPFISLITVLHRF